MPTFPANTKSVTDFCIRCPAIIWSSPYFSAQHAKQATEFVTFIKNIGLCGKNDKTELSIRKNRTS
ncbi:MAG TPA: hypothetical protein DIT05_18595 [Morganella sp. (in: Bacteria)]|nr:hypothetical protein [Morganella sp. (in: enterobacteria)]